MWTLRAALLHVLPVAGLVVGISAVRQPATAENTAPYNNMVAVQQQPAQQPDSTGSASETKIFTGKIVKNGDTLVLTDADGKMTYQLDDQQKAKVFFNKSVRVTGILDASTGTIRVSAIEPAA